VFHESVIIQQLISGLQVGIMYALMAVGFSLVFGVMDIVNFAHGAGMMAMMYVSFVLFRSVSLDPILGAPLIFALAFAVGVVVYRLVLRSISHAGHSTTLLATLGVAIVIENVVLAIFGGDLQSVVTSYTSAMIPFRGAFISVARSYAAGIALLMFAGLYYFLHRTDFGRAIRAVADDVVGAQVVGIPMHRIYAIAFAIGLGAAGVAGAVIIPFTLISPFVGVDFLTKSFVVVVVGGVGNVPGALAGGILLGLVEAFGSLFLPGSLVNGLVFGVLLMVLLFRPAGLFGGARG